MVEMLTVQKARNLTSQVPIMTPNMKMSAHVLRTDKSCELPSMVVHSYNPSRLRPEDYKFKASLGYIANSRPNWLA
jgi:hypothetical protein